MYYADVIEEELKLTTGGLVLYSLLAGNDLDSGVQGFGATMSLAVAQCGFGYSLVADCKSMNSVRQREYFEKLKESISDEVEYNRHGLLRGREPVRAQKLLQSNFPSKTALDWFLNPATSWSNQDPSRTLDISPPTPQIHDLPKIAQFCLNQVGWSPEQTLKRCHSKLWHGVIIRLLCSVREYVIPALSIHNILGSHYSYTVKLRGACLHQTQIDEHFTRMG